MQKKNLIEHIKIRFKLFYIKVPIQSHIEF